MSVDETPTIVALASAPGRAGVAVLRVSGPACRNVLQTMCGLSAPPEARRATLCDIVDHRTREIIDHALILFFPAPNSFTGEDVLELHLHGGRAIIHETLDALCALPSIRPAEPGEFSRRAFENGKMDLTEAEGIADLVDAETTAQRKQALRQMEGQLGRLYAGWAERLAHNLAYIEAEIDFADEDIPPDLAAGRRDDVAALAAEIDAHLNDGHRGERLREGFVVALLGAPNAGKSSLLNALAKREAAIVDPTPGTTRDIIEVQLDLGGYPVTLVDTAGLRDSADRIESEGIRRARAHAERADLKLLVFDGGARDEQNEPFFDATTLALADAASLIVINKADLMGALEGRRKDAHPHFPRHSGDIFSSAPFGDERKCNPESDFFFKTKSDSASALVPRERETSLCGMTGERDSITSATPTPLFLSAKTGDGLAALTAALTAEIDKRFAPAAQPALTRARHRVALEDCRDHLARALAVPEVELCAEDLRLAIRALGRITGRVDVEDLLDIIFSTFCIGK